MPRLRNSLILTLFIALCIAGTTACHKKDKVGTTEISGHIAEINEYGQLIPDFSPSDMKAAGFDYADLVEVYVGDDIHLTNIPLVTSFNETAILAPAYVDYNALGTQYGFGMLNGDFHYFIGGEVGDKCTVKLSSKGGYLKTYEILKSIYPVERRNNETAEQYANFRMVETTGIAEGVLYRSSNPLNCVNNPGRYRVADSLARVVGIKTEIDLADSPEKINSYISSESYESTYCPQLFKDGNTIACSMSSNTFSDDFKTKLANAIRFIISHESPYLIHCNEGKDRCGFVALLLESLAGAGIEEIRKDYMTTLCNFYQISHDGESYRLRQSLSVDRMMWFICNENDLDHFADIDWDGIDIDSKITDDKLRSSVIEFIKECGISEDEIDALKTKLSTSSPVL